MTLVFEQIFYGRIERGYGVLGVSPGGRSFVSRGEALCGAVGTPGGDYGGEPFLISVPDGKCVMMLCGRRGSLDSMGRSTLFFHVLIAEESAMIKAKADAFSLFSQGVFAGEMPSGNNITPLRVDVKPSTVADSQIGSVAHIAVPCVIRSVKPLGKLVRGVVGGRALTLSWATFAFQSMRGFDVQVLPPRVSCPQGANEYDATGTLLRSAVVADNPKEDGPSRNDRDERPCSSRGQIANTTNAASRGKSNVLFVLSVLANTVLVVVCFALLAARGSISSNNEPTRPAPLVVTTNSVATPIEKIDAREKIEQKQVSVSLSDEQKAKIEADAVRRFCEGLKRETPDNWWRDFDQAACEAGLDKYVSERDSQEFPKQSRFFGEVKKFLVRINEKTQEKKTP